MPDERGAIEVDGPPEPDLVGRRLAGFDEAVIRAVVVDAVHDKARLDAGVVQRVEPGRLDFAVDISR